MPLWACELKPSQSLSPDRGGHSTDARIANNICHFDDPNLICPAGLVPVTQLGETASHPTQSHEKRTGPPTYENRHHSRKRHDNIDEIGAGIKNERSLRSRTSLAL